MRTLLCFCLTVASVLATSTARADATLVVVQRAQAPAVPPSAVQALRQALASESRPRFQQGRALAARIRSLPPSSRDLDTASDSVLGREARELLEVVAFGRDEEAIAQGRAVLTREAPRLTITNRSELAARALGDVCLFVARALEHRGQRVEARAQVLECLRMLPDLSASADMHPEPVRRLVERARSEEASSLRVSARTASRQDCQLRVQGRLLGNVPGTVKLVSGTYSVEADCGAAGWLHTVVLRAGRSTHLSVSPNVEQALRWDDGLLVLHASERQATLRADLDDLIDWLKLSELWTVEQAEGRVRIQRLPREAQESARRVATTSTQPAASLPGRVRRIVAALTCEDSECYAPPRTSVVPRASLTAVSALGGAAMLGSWAAWYNYAELNEQLDRTRSDSSEYQRTLAARNERRDLAIVASSGGALLFGVGLPFWLPERQRVPLWAWSAGALGVAATVGGSVLWLAPKERYEVSACAREERCTRRPSPLPLAPMLVTQGASLLAVPVTYLVRGWTRADSIVVGVDASPGHMQVAWRQAVPGL